MQLWPGARVLALSGESKGGKIPLGVGSRLPPPSAVERCSPSKGHTHPNPKSEGHI